MNRIILTGVGGVGKSTLAEKLTDKEDDLDHLCYGDVLIEYGQEEYGIEGRKQLNEFITTKDIEKCDELFLEEIYERSDGSDLLIESRGVSSTDYGRKYDPFTNLEDIDPAGIVMIEAEPDRIHCQREKDSKYREQLPVSEINIEQQMTRSEAMKYGQDLETSVLYLDNNRSLNETVSDFDSLLKEIRN